MYRLALALGCTVHELGARMSAREMGGWIAYEQVCGPIGPERADIHVTRILHAIAMSVYGGKGKRPEITDFLPPWQQEDSKVSAVDNDDRLKLQAGQIFGSIAGHFERLERKEHIADGNHRSATHPARS